MPLPISIEKLIDGNIIENDRLECKEGWNPEKVLHTICAFANDVENNSGGYIIIGISDKDGGIGEIIGLEPEEITKIENELFNLCNLIEPRYIPVFSAEKYRDRHIAVIWAASDNRRPFKCPVKIGPGKNNSERAYYIRRMSHTIRANHDDEIMMMSIFRRTSFDDEVNYGAEVSDIDLSLVKNYLVRANSRMARETDGESILRSMRLVSGPAEALRPVNVGLMMFSLDIERFFPYARIEVVYKPDPTGEGMEENIFAGPLDLQLKAALTFIRGMVIREKVFKIPDKAEALRVFNFPFEAVEEIVVNAVYHKSYQIPEPVTITFTGDRLEILSLPGPDPSISDEDLADLRLKSWFYRNKRLGDFLKELRLAEGRNTGIPKIISALRKNGSPMPIYETNSYRDYLRVILHAHELFREDEKIIIDKPNVARKRRTRDEIKEEIVSTMSKTGCISTKELATALGYSSITIGLRECISDLMNEGVLEYLHPDNPTDYRQKICLVKK